MTRTFNLRPFENANGVSILVGMEIDDGAIHFKFEILSKTQITFETLKSELSRERKDELWKSNCFELFFSFGQASYFEMNLSPSGDWQFYEFETYRQRAALPNEFQIFQLQSQKSKDGYEISGTIESQTLNLTEIQSLHPCVILNLNGKNSFWAPQHNLGSPDFHCRSTWSNWKD
ncbi:MAG TPA: hypothetical protein DCL41_10505 [Bdellovibrionales bacterium]|nr:hypothetical protein [Pseudobdellovibrionaceae bacterium]HAG92296.1 hypothetical protein [Bdellovibrionales bacterium]|tara:strand:+ start:1939 stop:2463 length:525 start_codon:yes stop_codon:yes gene_type:complete